MILENAYVKSKLTKVTYKLESTKLQHEKNENYNAIVKGELTHTKKHLEKLYSRIEKLDE